MHISTFLLAVIEWNIGCKHVNSGAMFEDMSETGCSKSEKMIPAQIEVFPRKESIGKSDSHNYFEARATFEGRILKENTDMKSKSGKNRENNEGKELWNEKRSHMKTNKEHSDEGTSGQQTNNMEIGECFLKGNFVLKNSSVGWKGLSLGCVNGKSVICGKERSCVVLRGCEVAVGCGTSPLELIESCGIVESITLIPSSLLSFDAPPLFSSNAVENEKADHCRVAVASSCFSSFCLSSAPFLGSASIGGVSLSDLVFFNISTKPTESSLLSPSFCESECTMSSCSFSSVCDAYDGGIVRSINLRSSSLTASNISFVGCLRTKNVEFIGSEENPSKPGRQNETADEANIFTWCEWNGSKTTGTSLGYTDGASNGGAIYMYNLASGILTAKYCSFNDCYARSYGGGIACCDISSIEMEYNSFNSCTADRYGGGGIYAYSISTCIRISGCEYQNCKAADYGGGIFLESFNISGTGCIITEIGEGESACVFDCLFTFCSLTDFGGGGMYCYGVPSAFKLRSLQFISCNATSTGGGLCFAPSQSTAPSNNIYCYFFFFHDCSCNASTPYGHDVYFEDRYNLFSSNNPFYESYTTNANEKRVCYLNNTFQETQKKDWLKEGMKDRYVGVSGDDANNLCGMSEAVPCKTVGHAVSSSMAQLSSAITVLGGRHESEGTTISVGEKKISIDGKGREVSVIGTSALSTSSTTLFSVTSGQLEVGHVEIDHNVARSSSPSVFLVSVGSGSLLLEGVVILGPTGGSVISASVFDVALNQLKISAVEIKNMKMSQPLFSEPSSAGLTSGESVLGNLTIRNVNRTTGDGVVIAKSVKGGETFVVWNTTIEGCECVNGNGGGIKIELASSTSKARIGTSTSHSGGSTAFKQCRSSGYGGGVMLFLADDSFDFAISSVNFVGCSATLGGKDVFVNGSWMTSGTITAVKLNVGHNASIYDELMGYDRNEEGMGIFPLNVFLDAFSGAAHVGKEVNGYGGYDSWFCGFGYFPCKTITKAAQNRFSSSKKKIVLDSGFELGEVVSMAGSYEWEVYCGINKTNVNVKVPSGMTTSYLINVESASSIKNIAFQIPFSLSSATSLIALTSSSLTLTDCSVAHMSESTSSVAFGYSIVNAQSGSLKMERFVIEEGLTFNDHSAIEFCEGMTSVIYSGCNISGVVKNEGDGGWMKGTVGTSGMLTVDGCNVNGCSCGGGKGGGMCVELKGNGKVVVNGMSVIDGNKAENNGGRGTRGGGMFVMMESEGCGSTIEHNVKFSKDHGNMASYGKDVFVDCGSGVFLESKVNTSSFTFFDTSTIPSDALKLSGSENGDESGVIPLFVYLCSMGTKVIVDGSGGNGLDHNHCGFDGFRCLTVDYCANSRLSESSKEIEVVSSSSITNEIAGPSFCVIISGRIVSSSSSEGGRMGVNVSDGGSATQDWLVGCSSSLTMRRLSFVVKGQLNSRRSAFIHSTSTLSVTNCSVSFEGGGLTNGKIGYSIIDMTGGNLIVDGFAMESGVTLTMNGKSPISITDGVQLELKNSRVNGVEMNVEGGNGGGGCLNIGMNEGGSAKVEECNFSSTCSSGNGMKGGGMMISVGKGGSLEMNNVDLSECEVPSEDAENGGRGMGGGMFVELLDVMESFVLEGIEFEGCNAWKGKNAFVSGWDLSEIVNKEHLKWKMSDEELRSLDELCGWEMKTTGEDGYVIPLVVYLWSNWSGNGYVSKDGGGDFSGCGYSEAPCSSIDHLISLRYSTLGEGEMHIAIMGSGLLSHSISFSSSSPPDSQDSELPQVVIEGTKKGTAVIISDEDENDLNDSIISSNMSLSFANVSFTKPTMNTQHEILIESSGTNACLSVVDCSYGSMNGMTEIAGYCLMRVNGGSAMIQRCILNMIGELKGFISFSPIVTQVIVEDVNITNAGVMERSMISMTVAGKTNRATEKAKLKGERNCCLINDKQELRFVNCSFTNITFGENGAGVLSVGTFSEGMECMVESCSIMNCKSENSEEGGGMKVVLKSGESFLRINDSSFSMCKCSKVNGYGGGVMVDGVDLNEPAGNAFGSLGLMMENIWFGMNEAFVGKDVFIRCHSIEKQINETLFVLDFNQEALKSNNSIYGRDEINRVDVDLIPLIKFYYGVQVFVNVNGADGRECGSLDDPCQSINNAAKHIQRGIMNAIVIEEEGMIGGECEIGDARITSMKRSEATIHLNGMVDEIWSEKSIVVFVDECVVEKCLFVFGGGFEAKHRSMMKAKNGRLEICECAFGSSEREQRLECSIVRVESGELKMEETMFRDLHSSAPLLIFCEESRVALDETSLSNIVCEGDVVVVGGKAAVEVKEMTVKNISVEDEGGVMKMDGAKELVRVLNSSFEGCSNSKEKGMMVEIIESASVEIEMCAFDGEGNEEVRKKRNETMKGEEICQWNGSMIDMEKSHVEMKETTIRNCKRGGLSMRGGSLKIEKGEFENNNPSIEGYPSVRRNVKCSDSAQLNVVSVKGGDGIKDNTSLWILNEGCELEGIAKERASPFFIPTLRNVEVEKAGNNLRLIFKGSLLLPCNLSFRMISLTNDVEVIDHYVFEDSGFVDESEVDGKVPLSVVADAPPETEVSVSILFGNKEASSSAAGFVVKNGSKSDSKGNERIVEGGNEGKSYWLLIVCIAIVVILLVVIIVLAVQWKKVKNEAEDLREIVNDNIRKDPKAFEMVTMEMSPEEQWRRAEREAEKKNDERIKKRVYDTNMQHSESSEHLLSESGSTECILGKDSDKIPQWALEKVEEEKIRNRTPSPSISSTCSTDSDSTFVRGEDLCPTTSSMSNLVDAMACSSPHEKLIVDLRDSLFMLLHGLNKTKEIAIGSLKEREQTAAQVLFWVANGALHSFEDEEDELPSLSNLSPHIVLFSEHMVICIALHSDCSSDSDSSSISSSTIVTSASDDDESDSLPSSAFEDEDNYKKECLRWKAPELLMNRNMGATEKSVAFSIGMMLWECLTLEIPFGEYEAETTGQKIVNGERPDINLTEECGMWNVMRKCYSPDPLQRPTLYNLKREFIQRFHAGTVMLTVSDAIDLEQSSKEDEESKIEQIKEKTVTAETSQTDAIFI
ncbi:uncharacterized protein MONOS_12695 [Monocercomonoides exilis]|uniref:uncharacterized protein n=1 Tax=Monocercomonoides exilis TaxID=2049356 RepID=UPI003559C006|nr:hypothetical protein MONOS_12695 [Monocercomonoides exilis]|eukprot:MONOS_12695.1-p1 / transcript=MONOS_12695.1 / gene=MONOS_12695 / organism=Monocercomonoides_exilis_PA203 / gene_product=unspecified product / transcript_product=unspecified product / location=Mono_scaffold00720:1795-10983(+) / protein_length=3062 / sequence_SO=supercontig / SO=protein_coding / is_pseudo=false